MLYKYILSVTISIKIFCVLKIPVVALLVASVRGAVEKAATLPIVQYASPYGYGAPYLGAGPLA